MTIYDRNCNATRYLAIKEWQKQTKRKTIRANLWCITSTALLMCVMVEIARGLS